MNKSSYLKGVNSGVPTEYLPSSFLLSTWIVCVELLHLLIFLTIKAFSKDPRFFSSSMNTELWLLQTPSDKYLMEVVASWIKSVHCGFTALRAGWRLHCSVKYMDIRHCTSLDSYPRCTSSVVKSRHCDLFPHCARGSLAALSWGWVMFMRNNS